MNKSQLVSYLEEAIPPLQNKLHLKRVLYNKTDRQAIVCFDADVLVAPRDQQLMKRKLQQLLPDVSITLKISATCLKDDFLRDITPYRTVLEDFLCRQNKAMSAWINDIGWSMEGNVLFLTCPDDMCLNHIRRHRLDQELADYVEYTFGFRPSVELALCGERETWIAQMRSSRNMPIHEEPPLLSDEQLAAQEAALHESAPAPKPKPKANVIRGRSIGDTPVPIVELTGDDGTVTIEGTVTALQDVKELRGGESVLQTFAVYDDTSTIYCKSFYYYHARQSRDEKPAPPTPEEKAKVKEQLGKIKEGVRVRVRGICKHDTFLREPCIEIRDMQLMPVVVRMDEAPEKRIELHAHTKMSMMDAVTDTTALIKTAARWGHTAIAITDHGCSQSFPEAFKAAKDNNIKLLPGVEGYLCDMVESVTGEDSRPFASTPIVVLDFETTGLSHKTDRIIEVGAVKISGGKVLEEFSELCNPGISLKAKISNLTGIRDMDLEDKRTPAQVVQDLLTFIGDCPLAAHNAPFDVGMLKAECRRMGQDWNGTVLDTLVMSRKVYPDLKSHKLGSVCRSLGISLKNAHRAVHDAAATAQCLVKMLEETAKLGAETFNDINRVLTLPTMGESHHIVLLCRTQKGMQNLNHLITDSNLFYFYRHPNMPREDIERYREGLILGSACEAGELYRAIADDLEEAEIERIASWYDYLEIQPLGNNAFMLREGLVDSEDDLRDYNRRIVALGEKLNKPVVATGDVHFLNPEDAIYRAVIQAGHGYEDCDEQPPLYFKTTEEMLKEFGYLGKQKAREVVIDNPRKIAESVETLRLFPKHPEGKDTFQPFWEDAADDITNRAWSRAKELYGDPLPEIVEKRLNRELGCIVGYGFSTLYSIAQKLVSKSNADGYIVGSRGSVGSSFVATMNGITEVNPLPPHYRCDHCHRMVLAEKPVSGVGVDLPDRCCEICGQPMAKDGFEIPFEVFLGFKGDKVPDIDLNFGSEYQPRAHAYIEELFGKGFVFRAGTISGLAEKTAFGYAAKYLEERGIQAGSAHKERLAKGCEGVKRTTGQHPGGIVVLPKEYDICQFTAIQHPADDTDSNTLTTHYDFNSMHDILVKLDCLGHDDPSMIHLLEELTGVHYKTIPLTDPKVMSLFTSPESLGVSKEDILWETGTLGIPEFGTGFVKGVLQATKPTTMEELVRISGLSHGTDVWLGNADEIIRSGKAVLRECFCTRDDIMNYLISMGLENKMSFDIMEAVRKGRGVKPEWEEAMKAHDVPAWAIDSLKKIKYMFPRGHAVAYVTMALRVAWFKVYHPLAYYAAYFTIRADGFDAGRMLLSAASLKDQITEMENSEDKLSAKDKQELVAYHMLLEMAQRGIRLLPCDLYHSEAKRFLIEDGNIRCPYNSISGFGEVGQRIVDARRDGKFLSLEDLKNRAHIGDSVLEMLRAQGALEGLGNTNQMDLFSLIG